MYPHFELSTSKKNHYILSAQKKNVVGTAHYIITMGKDEKKRSCSGFLGKIRSNNSGDEYNIYGPGENPDKKLTKDKTRSQLGAVYYVVLLYMI